MIIPAVQPGGCLKVLVLALKMNFASDSFEAVFADLGSFSAMYAPRAEVRFGPPDWKELADFEEWAFNLTGFMESVFISDIVEKIKTSKSAKREFRLHPTVEKSVVGTGEDNRYCFQRMG